MASRSAASLGAICLTVPRSWLPVLNRDPGRRTSRQTEAQAVGQSLIVTALSGKGNMQRPSRRLIAAFVFVSLPLGTVLLHAQARSALPTSTSTAGIDPVLFNKSVDPCTDFYQFACGGWLAANPIPADRPRWGRFDELSEKNDVVLRRVLEAAATGRDPASKKIGDYFATCMDEQAIERNGAKPLEPDLKNIAALTNINRLPELVAELHKIGVGALFSFGSEPDMKNASIVIAGADQGGMGLPDRDYYFREDARSVDIRKQYVDHIAKML